MPATEACSFATWDSRAMVILSRNLRCTRVLTVRRNQVAVQETPRPSAAIRIRFRLPASTPLPSNMSHSASSASGTAVLREDVILRPLFIFRRTEALRLQIEHRSIPAPLCHQLIVRTEFDHAAVLENANPVSMTDC